MKDLLIRVCRILDKDQRKKLLILIFFMVIGAGLEAFSVSLIIPYIMSLVASEVDLGITLLLIGAFGFKNIYLYWLKCIQNHFIVKNCSKASIRLFKIYLSKPYEYFLYNNSNKIVTTINVYVTKSFVMIGEMLNLSAEIVVSIFLFIVLISVNFKVTFIMFTVLIVLSLLIKLLISSKLRDIGKQSNEAYLGMVTGVSQAINGIKEIKMFGREKFFLNSYEDLAKSNVTLENKKNKYSNAPRHITEFVAVCAMLIVVYLSSANFQLDTSQIVSQTALFSFVLLRMLPSVIRINGYLNQIAYYTPSLLAIDDEVSSYMKNEEDEVECEAVVWKLEDSIRVNNVSFSYDHSGENLILDGADLEILKGEFVGIIGASGIGKTTLIDIILGYLEPDKGLVEVDGINIHNNLQGWRKNIGYVPQMIYLMDDTIRNNIAFGDDACRDEKIWNILKRVNLYDFVKALPKGLDSYVGERGIRLSGGQRQRIGIARALYNSPDILVLDEATSSLDNDLEVEIMEDIYNLHGEKTVIIIAHRISSLSRCNKIYKISSGKIARI